MLSFARRSNQKELLDNDQIPFEDIRQNLIELNVINTWLGGHSITLAGINKFIKKPATLFHIVEIGCGGGDNLAVIGKYLTQKNLPFKLTGIDIKKECITYAQQQYPSIEFICADYKDVHFEQKPGIIFNSLFCHHFSHTELIEVFKWMKCYAELGFFINDLQRHYLAYYLIKMLTSLFSKSYLVKNDAPLSVARSFKQSELKSIIEEAGISNYHIRWKWAFRYLLWHQSEKIIP